MEKPNINTIPSGVLFLVVNTTIAHIGCMCASHTARVIRVGISEYAYMNCLVNFDDICSGEFTKVNVRFSYYKNVPIKTHHPIFVYIFEFIEIVCFAIQNDRSIDR